MAVRIQPCSQWRAGYDMAVLDWLRADVPQPGAFSVQAAEELLAPLGLGRRPSEAS